MSFEIPAGSLVGLLGDNGAGKTTLMDILAGVSHFQVGRVSILGETFLSGQEPSTSFKKQLGYLPDQPPLYSEMRVEDYLHYAGALKKMLLEKIQNRCEEVLNDLGLQHHRRTVIAQLSKGFRQRVGMAQALINDPRFLILDEPTVALDPTQRAQLKELIVSLKGSCTILLSTHILSDVEDICDQVIFIDRGRISEVKSLHSEHHFQGSCVFSLSLSQKVQESELFLLEHVQKVQATGDGQWLITFAESELSMDEVSDRYLCELSQRGWGVRRYGLNSNNLEELFFHKKGVERGRT